MKNLKSNLQDCPLRMRLKVTSQNPLKEVSQVVFDLNERECVKAKRLMPSNPNQSEMLD